jgi:hypothetical protein
MIPDTSGQVPAHHFGHSVTEPAWKPEALLGPAESELKLIRETLLNRKKTPGPPDDMSVAHKITRAAGRRPNARTLVIIDKIGKRGARITRRQQPCPPFVSSVRHRGLLPALAYPGSLTHPHVEVTPPAIETIPVPVADLAARSPEACSLSYLLGELDIHLALRARNYSHCLTPPGVVLEREILVIHDCLALRLEISHDDSHAAPQRYGLQGSLCHQLTRADRLKQAQWSAAS